MLKKELKKRLRSARRIGVLCVGSELRGDDAAGILVAGHLGRARNTKRRAKLRVFIGGTAPENLTGQIRKFKPEHLVIVDSAEMGKRPGAVRLIDTSEIGGFSFCTHRLPLKMLADYLAQSLGCAITVIGIQPKGLDFGSRSSKITHKAAQRVSDAVRRAAAGS